MVDVVHRYLRLGLRFGRLDNGLVDSYVGPHEVAEVVSAEPAPTAHAVATEAEVLLADLPDSWLRDQVAGIRTYAKALAGGSRTFVDEVEGCYGAHVTFTDESVFEAAQEQISRLLPGPQPLAERYRRWRQSTHVPVDHIAPLLTDAIELGRAWTQQLIALPAGERLDVELVQGQPWSGFHEYAGDFHGRIRINTDTPRTVLGLIRLAFASGSSEADVLNYLRRWRLIEGNSAQELMRFLRQPALRTYVAVYPAGRELCHAFVNGDPQQFRRLLTEQLRVSDLRK